MRTYFIILIIVLVLFFIVRGCDRHAPALFRSLASHPDSADTPAKSLPPTSEQKTHMKRLRARKERELAAVRKFTTAVKSSQALIGDHLNAIHGYLDEPHLDDTVWRDNIKTETRGLQDEVQAGRAAPAPPHGREIYRAYLAALGDYASGSTELERGLDLQDEEWIARSSKRLDTAAEKHDEVIEQLKAVQSDLTARLDQDAE